MNDLDGQKPGFGLDGPVNEENLEYFGKEEGLGTLTDIRGGMVCLGALCTCDNQ